MYPLNLLIFLTFVVSQSDPIQVEVPHPLPPRLQLPVFAEPILLKSTSSQIPEVVHVEGTLRIQENTKKVKENITILVELPEDTSEITFFDLIGISEITDEEGNQLKFSRSQGYQGLSFVYLPVDQAHRQSPLKLHIKGSFTLSGKFNLYSPILGNFGDITYLGGLIFPVTNTDNLYTTDLWVEVPQGRVVAGSGVTTEVQFGVNGWDRYHIVSDKIMDSYALVVGDFYQWRTRLGPRIIEAYLNPTVYGDLGNEILQLVRDVVDFYGSRYGAVLFDKVALGLIPDEVGAGLGWPGLVWLPNSMLMMDGPNGRIHYVAHELGHQWFPDTLKNDDSFAPWLSEGFAEYSSVTYVGHVLGERYAAGFRELYGMMYRHISDLDMDYPLTSFTAAQPPNMDVHMIVTYFKGCVVVRTLEEVVGTDNFLKAIKTIRKDNAGKEDFYNTRGLRKYLEEASGLDLEKYFSEWVYHTGYPKYVVSLKRGKPDGGYPVTLTIFQESSESYNKFEMPVEVQFIGPNMEVETHRLQVKEGENTLKVKLPFYPLRAVVDPDYTFIKSMSPSLEGDVDYSGTVDARDLALVAAMKGASMYRDPLGVSRYDVNHSGKVDDNDVGKVLGNLGRTE